MSSNPKRLIPSCILLAAFALLTSNHLPAQNQDSLGDTNLAQKLDITVQPGEVIGRDQIVRYLINCGTNQFLFMLPPNVRSTGTASESIILSGTDGRYYLSFRVLKSRTASPDPARFKELAIETYPGAQQLEEFPISIAGHEGTGLEFRQELAVVGNRLIRLARVPCLAGTLEFSLNADPKNAAVALQALECVLLSFQSNERGAIVVIPRSDKS